MDASIYKRPDKPLSIPVRDWRNQVEVQLPAAPQPVLTLDKSTECHVTPPEVAQRMVEYLDPSPQSVIGEPSAGTGHLVQALLEAKHPLENVISIERHTGLVDYLHQRFEALQVINDDFLAVHHLHFDGVVMNPPFAKGAAKKHIAHAYSLLNPNSVLIALVPSTFEYPEAYELEQLPRGTFSSTDVRTKIIEINK